MRLILSCFPCLRSALFVWYIIPSRSIWLRAKLGLPKQATCRSGGGRGRTPKERAKGKKPVPQLTPFVSYEDLSTRDNRYTAWRSNVLLLHDRQMMRTCLASWSELDLLRSLSTWSTRASYRVSLGSFPGLAGSPRHSRLAPNPSEGHSFRSPRVLFY